MDTDPMPLDIKPPCPEVIKSQEPAVEPTIAQPLPLGDLHDRKATPKPDALDKMERVPTPLAVSRSDSRDIITQAEDLTVGASTSQRSRRASPMDPHSLSTDRPLNVTDALTYLDDVKVQFQDKPDVYNHFLDIMKEFKNELIDTPGVISRVSELFTGHPALIQGFNTFLPVGYRIECSTDAYDTGIITVTTPTGTTIQTTNVNHSLRSPPWSTSTPHDARHDGGLGYGANSNYPGPPASPEPRGAYGAEHPQAIEPAVQYVQKIKQRCDPETYRQFLDILSRYHHKPETINEEEVSRQIAKLFKDAPDLRNDFRVFMPERNQPFVDDLPSHASTRDKDKNRRKLDVVANSMSSHQSLPLKRKRKAAEKEREREKESTPAKTVPPAKRAKHAPTQDLTPLSYNPKHVIALPPSPHRTGHHVLPPQPHRLPVTNDETMFFDRVKRALDNRDLYTEFLKLVNLFAQNHIDTARLVKESRNFLGNTELYKQFREILGWDEKKEREHFLSERHSQSSWTKPAIAGLPERPGRIDLNEKYGSYRKVSAGEANVPCSGRDEMCRSVLNDEWVSHPTWTSEDSGFGSHRKNIYEEALHRSEEERHEYDFHLDAIHRTILMLEPINNKIAQMGPEDRANFKLKPNLGGSWKAIHQRVIKKIYGREAGLEVIHAMQDVPVLAFPAVLQRLKQKQLEWKRAQSEWNKVWREVDARNYSKSLDHHALSFKAADKKALTVKSLVNQIETAREEQQAKRAALIDPLFARTRPRYQLEFSIDNEGVLQDAIKLTFSFLDRTQGQLNPTERKRIESFLRTFIPLFFALNPVEFNSSFVVHEIVESDTSDVEVASAADENEGPSVVNSVRGAGSGGGRNGRKHVSNVSSGGDLRKKLLKSEQAKSTNRKTRAQEAGSPAVSRFASPVIMMEEPNGEPFIPAKRSPKVTNVFFTNTTFYALTRLIELLYSRLTLFKNIAARLPNPNMVPTSRDEGTRTPRNHHYEMLLVQCERLFTNEIEQQVFEDQTRAIFGVKNAYKIFTVDKLIGGIIKQVQTVIADPKSQELLEALKRERMLPFPTTQDRLNYQHQAEKVLGPDENVFRIDWLSDMKTMTVQLIGKDDENFDSTEALSGRWQSYIDAFVSAETTEGVSQARMRRPFLRKNLPAAVRETQPDVSSKDGLEIKVCLQTYRLFYVPHTEDFMWRYRRKQEMENNGRQLKLRNAMRRKWLKEMGHLS